MCDHTTGLTDSWRDSSTMSDHFLEWVEEATAAAAASAAAGFKDPEIKQESGDEAGVVLAGVDDHEVITIDSDSDVLMVRTLLSSCSSGANSV
jgi:hypothetical protein